MPIKISEIKVGYEYKACENQDRVVLGFTEEGKVVYVSRGGGRQNPYKDRVICKKERFAKACYEIVGKIKKKTLDYIIQSTSSSPYIF